jgi:hypothetical protein
VPQEQLSAGGNCNGLSITSKQEKKDYRIATRRKVMAEKEMDFANVLKSKDWSGGTRGTSGVAAAAVAIMAHHSLGRTVKNVGGIWN